MTRRNPSSAITSHKAGDGAASMQNREQYLSRALPNWVLCLCILSLAVLPCQFPGANREQRMKTDGGEKGGQIHGLARLVPLLFRY